jgi:hypothetical protein
METRSFAARPPALLVSGRARSFASHRSRRFAVIGTNPSGGLSVRPGVNESLEVVRDGSASPDDDRPRIGPSAERLRVKAWVGARGWAAHGCYGFNRMAAASGAAGTAGSAGPARPERDRAPRRVTPTPSGAWATRFPHGSATRLWPKFRRSRPAAPSSPTARRPPRTPDPRWLVPGAGAPSGHAGLEPERGGHEQDRRALDGERPVQLGEPEVVADRQADSAELGLGRDDLVPGREDGRLAARDRAGRIGVEQVDLAVGRDELARAVEQHARVEDPLAVAFEDTAAVHPHPMPGGDLGEQLGPATGTGSAVSRICFAEPCRGQTSGSAARSAPSAAARSSSPNTCSSLR